MQCFVQACVFMTLVFLAGNSNSAATVEEVNKFVDTMLTTASKNNKVLDGLTMPDFDLKIKSDKIFLKDITGKFRKGKMVGFKNVKRAGSCSVPKKQGDATVISCKLSLADVSVKYEALVKGFNVVGTEKKIDYTNKIVNTVAMLDLEQKSGKPPGLKTFFIDVVNTEATYPDLDFNEERKKKFKIEVDKKASPAIFDAFYKTYADAMKDFLKTATLPSA